MLDVERRQLAARDAQVGVAGARTITGYAAVLGSLSENLGGFREVILPGAFDRALREAHDVRALVNHNPDLILGRTKPRTLKLAVDAHGLRAEIIPPDTTAARDAVASIRRGDLDGMSFGFRTPPGSSEADLVHSYPAAVFTGARHRSAQNGGRQ